ncbi:MULTISPECIES: GrpB family protein [Ensifer]|uniref:GrpB family protein n=1 Tax=Ensifer TaxID=106591 RepID=UPI002E0EBB3A
MRERPDYAERYETLKKRLAADANGDWDIYTHGKRDFIDEVLAAPATKKAPPLPAGPLY